MSKAPYVPPTVWKNDAPSGGQFASINRPVAGPTHDKVLPVGKQPLQLYSLATPNGQKVTILLEELLALGHTGAEYDAWLIKIGDGDQTLAILDGAGGDLWRHITRAAITLHATAYPNIGTVMYLQADGNLQTMQAQLRTLVTRKVTGIVSYDDFGPAMTAAFQQATNAGIPVSVYGGTPGPDAVNAVLTQVQSDFCDDGYQMAEATQKIIGDAFFAFADTPENEERE